MDMIDIVIQKQDGSSVKLSLKNAVTELQQRQGLMYVKKLIGYDGMFFNLGEEQLIRMWMMNTFIPLDMLFFDSACKLVYIHENAVPHDKTSLGCNKPVLYVIEIDGGRAKTLGITIGDICEY